MNKIDTDTIRATAQAQRKHRNVSAMHAIANATKPTHTCCGQVQTLDSQILHALYTCPNKEK